MLKVQFPLVKQLARAPRFRSRAADAVTILVNIRRAVPRAAEHSLISRRRFAERSQKSVGDAPRAAGESGYDPFWQSYPW
jgi:hypothetical protein